ncbi:MAG: NAD(P)-dependent oxidoreductase [Brooklawnia sp.]|nr:NAD(P)-dependent oxidoreductase [Brooklawnia sp.]
MSNPSVAVLGTGTMGAGVARTLLRNGFRVSVWNRSRGRAEPLAADGASVASSPAEAVRAADVVLTVVFDGPAVLDVLQQARGAWGADALLMQCATVGVAAASQIAAEAEQSGVAMIEAMMLGTKGPAQTGKLRMLVSGDPRLVERARPVLDAMGERTVVAGEQLGDASRLKLACNSWLGMLTAGTAQSMALLRGWGLDPSLFIEAVADTQSDSKYVAIKGGLMASGDYAPNFALDGLLKDLRLGAEEAVGVDTGLLTALGDLFEKVSRLGHGGEDIAAVYRGL